MKETKITKQVSGIEFIQAGLPIFVIPLIGVWMIKFFYSIVIVNWTVFLMAGCFSWMLIHIGGLGIYRFWKR